MAPGKDLYAVLGIGKDSDAAAITKAFRRLARLNHPDKNPDDPEAKERFQAINEAYRVLGDPVRRGRYDQTGQTEEMDPQQELAKQALILLLNAALDQDKEPSENIVASIRNKVRQNSMNIRDAMTAARKHLGRIDRLSTRLSGPLVSDLIQARRDRWTRTISEYERGLETDKRIIALLDDYNDNIIIATDFGFKGRRPAAGILGGSNGFQDGQRDPETLAAIAAAMGMKDQLGGPRGTDPKKPPTGDDAEDLNGPYFPI